MKPHLHVEQANLSHVSFLSEFGKESFIDAYKLTLPMEELRAYVDGAFSEKLIKREMESSEALYLICKNSKGVICGYAKILNSEVPDCVTDNKAIELQRLYVKNESRGKGVGGILFENGEAISKQKGFNVVWLRVWDGNTAAQNIYVKWGYTFCGKEWYEVGKEKRKVLVMMKHI
ncbi:GNAT family N-acetyltransferase [Methanolobus mangrovi]|uniref:GNAT family N-acetyltransferase n=1 Tax=Methanolobus mangrovi TaxID=3072977 RepID=A0AA51YH60_9EURY|nr:GNAT family N-acetyltransferase [Methanolobus mangrovi]WMW22831.1 GNAT family N-acetyltransferase [Methanolobus mangrovi]